MLDPLDRRLVFVLRADGTRALESVQAILPATGKEEFLANADGSFKSPGPNTRLTAEGSNWLLTDYSEKSITRFDSNGRILAIRYFSGGGADVRYDSVTGRPLAIRSMTGREVGIGLSPRNGFSGFNIGSLTLPDRRTIGLLYSDSYAPSTLDAGRLLSAVVFQDGSRQAFTYEPSVQGAALQTTAGLLSAGFEVPIDFRSIGSAGNASIDASFMLRGRPIYNLKTKVDERGTTYASFSYDDQGRVTRGEHAGGAYTFTYAYPSSTQTVVTEPLGAASTWTFADVANRTMAIGLTRTGRDVATQTRVWEYDTTGNLSGFGVTGAGGGKTCREVDPATGLERARIEGLAAGATCPVASTYRPVATAGSVERKFSYLWHPQLRLQTRVAEPSRITTYVYQGQPDPTASNAIANCMPTGASTLPGGLALGVLCKRIEQATTDERGAAGFAAVGTGAPRVWSFTYDATGRILTENGPRADVGDTTTYGYFTSAQTDGANNFGELRSVTNAAGQTTTIQNHDANGRPLLFTDPQGVTTTLTYTARGWPLRVVQSAAGASRATVYEYLPNGLISKVTQPDGSTLVGEYDNAQRLVGVRDSAGNSVRYILDAEGNRSSEQIRDPSGALSRQIGRVFDAMNRLRSVTGSPQ
jgi:YD repeat-containing protein